MTELQEAQPQLTEASLAVLQHSFNVTAFRRLEEISYGKLFPKSAFTYHLLDRTC
jgi:hypothetical protein